MKLKMLQANMALHDLHRRFLELERRQAQVFFDRKIGAYDFLQLLAHDKSFAWLQPFSSWIAQNDEFLEKTEKVTLQDLKLFHEGTMKMFAENSVLRDRYQAHMSDPEFILLHVRMKQTRSSIVESAAA